MERNGEVAEGCRGLRLREMGRRGCNGWLEKEKGKVGRRREWKGKLDEEQELEVAGRRKKKVRLSKGASESKGEKGKWRGAAAAAKRGRRLQHPNGEKSLGSGFFYLGFFMSVFFCPFTCGWYLPIYRVFLAKIPKTALSLRTFFNLVPSFRFVRFDPQLTVKLSICSILPL